MFSPSVAGLCVLKSPNFWWKLLRTVRVSQEVTDNPVGSQNKARWLTANLHEWRKRATLHTRCHGGVPAEFMRVSFARSKQLLSVPALWEALCMKLEGRGKVANQRLRQVALKLLDVSQIEQLAVPLRSDRDRLGEMRWRKRSLPCSLLISPHPLIHTLLFFSRV